MGKVGREADGAALGQSIFIFKMQASIPCKGILRLSPMDAPSATPNAREKIAGAKRQLVTRAGKTTMVAPSPSLSWWFGLVWTLGVSSSGLKRSLLTSDAIGSLGPKQRASGFKTSWGPNPPNHQVTSTEAPCLGLQNPTPAWPRKVSAMQAHTTHPTNKKQGRKKKKQKHTNR